jgi:hypothetical protein
MLALCIALLLNTIWFWNSPRLDKRIAIPLTIYFALAAVGRAHARNRKIEDLK